MTLKSFLSEKKHLFSAWEHICCTGISIIGLFPLYDCIWAYWTRHIWFFST